MQADAGNADQPDHGETGDRDRALIRRFSLGDRSAFDELVADHQQRVARLAYRLLGWSGDADDVVQEVFLAAWRGLRRFRGRSALGTWLQTITVNKCRSYRRRRFLRLTLLGGQDRETQTNDSPRQAAMERETFEQVRRAMQALPGKYREVAVLRYLEEMPLEDVCEVLRIKRSTAGVRLHRARAMLKERLADLVEDK